MRGCLNLKLAQQIMGSASTEKKASPRRVVKATTLFSASLCFRWQNHSREKILWPRLPQKYEGNTAQRHASVPIHEQWNTKVRYSRGEWAVLRVLVSSALCNLDIL
jgi:hypothetical protein